MGKGFLIDTNVVIDFAESKIPSTGNDFVAAKIRQDSHISVINKMELLGFPSVPAIIVEFVTDTHILQLSDEIAERTISIRKAHRLKLPDAIIAATALCNDMTLITRNTKDFKKIEGLRVVDPYSV